MDINEFTAVAVENGLAKSQRNLKQYLSVLFEGVDFNGKSFLDIGGGTGVFTHYAAFKGANRAVCMEPEDDGSTSGVTENFTAVKNRLNAKGEVTLDNHLFQDFTGEPFDIVLLHNSVNHLDEPACENVLKSSEARDTFIKLFKDLNNLVVPGGTVIVCDCGRKNFFGDIGITNPVMPTIEWEKHQEPKVWGALMEQAGFSIQKIKWNTFNSLGKFGPLFLGYFLPSYFTLSHFRLYVKKT